jgi:hypothetical protein
MLQHARGVSIPKASCKGEWGVGWELSNSKGIFLYAVYQMAFFCMRYIMLLLDGSLAALWDMSWCRWCKPPMGAGVLLTIGFSQFNPGRQCH